MGQGTHVRRVASNGLLAAIQSVVGAAAYLILYRIVIGELGLGALGLLTTTLAIASVVVFFDLGMSEGLARTVAIRAHRAGSFGIGRLMEGGLLFVLLTCGIAAVALYWALGAWVESWLHSRTSISTDALVPLALGYCVTLQMTVASMGVLEGLEQYRTRLAAASLGALALVVASYLLVPKLGLSGAVIALIGQSLVTVAVAAFGAYRLTGVDKATGNDELRNTLKELLAIGLPIKATGLAALALDPFTKVLMMSSAGPAPVGAYEIAARLVVQLRSIIVSGTQASLPRLSQLAQADQPGAGRLEASLKQLGDSVSAISFAALLIVLPAVCIIVVSHVEWQVVGFAAMLSFGWAINAASATSFFALIANRHLRPVWLSALIMSILNLTLGLSIGLRGGPWYIVGILSSSVAAGSIYTIAKRQSDQVAPRMRPTLFVGKRITLAIALSLSLCYAGIAILQTKFSQAAWSVGLTLLFVAISAPIVWLLFKDLANDDKEL